MKLLIWSTILLWMTLSGFVTADLELVWSIQDDLKALNVSCKYDTCAEGRIRDNLETYACQCEKACVQFGTCCIDSQHSKITPSIFKPTCRSLDVEKSFYMMDRCPPESVWRTLCEEESYNHDDIMRIVPVTSLFTLMTYKNYFCMRCHEDTDEFWYWNVRLGSSEEFDKTAENNERVPLSYDREYQTWVAPLGPGGSFVAVVINVEIPPEINSLPLSCDSELISNCPDSWLDEEVRGKCGAYMSQVHIKKEENLKKYKNMHCAKCNSENLTEIECKVPVIAPMAGGKKRFSFTFLLDINRSDGDKVGKIEKCQNNYLWDPYSNICRKLGCALPGYVMTNGKCVKP